MAEVPLCRGWGPQVGDRAVQQPCLMIPLLSAFDHLALPRRRSGPMRLALLQLLSRITLQVCAVGSSGHRPQSPSPTISRNCGPLLQADLGLGGRSPP